MNTKEYIQSGIVESYVLGLASEEEKLEFESMCNRYPEIQEARTAFELSLEQAAISNAVTPPSFVRDQIFNQFPDKKNTLSSPAPVRKMNWIAYAAAACVILLAGSIYYNITLNHSNQSLRASNDSLRKNYDNTVARLNDIEKDIEVLRQNPSIKMASMKGMDASPGSFATVYWDTTSHDVYLLTNNLPVPASGKQYQLWAIFNGQPVDLGVFDIKKEKLLIQAKNAQGAEAFAITLEEKGGSPTPKGAMYVMGKL